MKIKYLFIWIVLFCRVWGIGYGQNNNPTITVCNGQQLICASSPTVDLCVTIVVNPLYQHVDRISHFEIQWGDGSPLQNIPASMPADSILHTFVLDTFFNSCIFQRTYTIILETIHDDPAIEPTNSVFLLTIRNPPPAPFIISPQPSCSGSPVALLGSSDSTVLGNYPNCPPLGLNYHAWSVSNGIQASGSQLHYTFDTAGIYNVQYCAGNSCDTVCTSQLLEVLDAGQAVIDLEEGALMIDSAHYQLCLYDTLASVRLNGGLSPSATYYSWILDGPSGWSWQSLTADSSEIKLSFSQPGIYRLQLVVSNDCLSKDTTAIDISVLAPPVHSLLPQVDTCQNFFYTPLPFRPEVSYRINDAAPDSIPLWLTFSTQAYIVEAVWEHFCGTYSLQDTFFIRPIPPLEIISPAVDQALCIGEDTLFIQATAVEQWLGGENSLRQDSSGVYFLKNSPGQYQLIATAGTGACSIADTLQLLIESPYSLDLDTPELGCVELAYTPSPYDSVVNYSINGQLQPHFPVLLNLNGAPYLIRAQYTNACGNYEDSTIVNVIQPEEVQILAPQDSLLCKGGNPVLLVASDSIGQWLGDYLVGGSNETFFTPVATGHYLIVFERGTDYCRRTDSIHLEVISDDLVDAGDDMLVCQNLQALQLSAASPPGGQYSGYAINGSEIDLHLLLPDSSYLYWYTLEQLPEGCNTDSLYINTALPPSAAFTLSKDTACLQETVFLQLTQQTGVFHRIDWGDGESGSTTTHEYAQPGTYTILHTAYTLQPATLQPLCVASDSMLIYIRAPIPPGGLSFIAEPAGGCAPLSVSFHNTSQDTLQTFVWDLGNGQSYTGIHPPVQLYEEQQHQPSQYQVRLMVPGACGDTLVNSTIGVSPRPVANFGIVDQLICSGAAVDAIALSLGIPDEQYFLLPSGQILPVNNGQSIPLQFFADSSADTLQLGLVAYNSCGIDTFYRQIIVNPSDVTAQLSGDQPMPLCEGNPFTLYSASTPGASVRWLISDGDSYLGDSVRLHFEQAGYYELTLYAYGCGFDSLRIPLQVQAAPPIELEHDSLRCPDLPITFEINGASPAQIILDYGDGQQDTLPPYEHSYGAAGNFPVRARALYSNGCIRSADSQVRILPKPQIEAVVPDSLCAGQQAIFTGNREPESSSCRWQFGDGNFSGSCTALHTYETAGDYAAIFSAVSPEGCRQADTLRLHVRESPKAAFDFSVPNPCRPQMIQLTSTSLRADGWQWRAESNVIGHSETTTYTFDTFGLRRVDLLVENRGICRDSVTRWLEINPNPLLALTLTGRCKPNEGSFLQISSQAENSLHLSGEGYSASGQQHPALAAGYYQLQLQTPFGCIIDTSLYIPPNQAFEIAAIPDSFDIFLGESIQLTAVSNLPTVDYRWEPITYLQQPMQAATLAQPLRSLLYYIYGTDDRGCEAIDTVWVRVRADRGRQLFLPDAFSPNNDGINDVFYPRTHYPAIERIEEFIIVDKYNETVFDAQAEHPERILLVEDPDIGWKGDFRGQKAEAGVYRYRLSLRYIDGEVYTFTGNVILIR